MKFINVVTNSDETLASFRLRQKVIGEWINQNSTSWRMYQSTRIDPKANINLFHKHSNPSAMLQMVSEARRLAPETKIFFDVSDYWLEDPNIGPFYKQMASICDVVTVSSVELQKVFREINPQTFVVYEPYEGEVLPESNADHSYVWFGHSSNLPELEKVLPTLDSSKLTIIGDVEVPGIKFKKWTPDFHKEINNFKFSLLPQSNKYKSPNRFIQSVTSGCTPLTFNSPCYKLVEEELSVLGREAFIAKYHVSELSKLWIELFEQALQLDKPEKPNVQHELTKKPYVRLNLGCGTKIYPRSEGWVNIDTVKYKGVDIVAKVENISTVVGLEVADEIHAYHVVEHIFPQDLPKVLRDWFNTLKPGGKICLEMPCMLKAAKNILQLETTENKEVWFDLGLKAFYGDYNPNNMSLMADIHKWAWTYKTLKTELEKVGFINCVEETPCTHRKERDFRIVATKKDKNV